MSKTDQHHVSLAVGISIGVGLCVLLMLNACNRKSNSRNRIELHDIPEANTPGKSVGANNVSVCPPGDPPGNDASSSPAGRHSVSLSWNASSSANGPYAKEVRYCLYRTQGGPVQASHAGIVHKSPCVNCQRVTIAPISGTTYKDTWVANDIHYCYVAIAIEGGNIVPSGFSNQADAVIPPRTESPFCDVKDTTIERKSSVKHHH